MSVPLALAYAVRCPQTHAGSLNKIGRYLWARNHVSPWLRRIPYLSEPGPFGPTDQSLLRFGRPSQEMTELDILLGLDRATAAALGPGATAELIDQITIWSTVEARDLKPKVLAPDELVAYLFAHHDQERSTVIIDAQFIAPSTVYGDVVAQSGAVARILRLPDGAPVAVRVPPGISLPVSLSSYPSVSEVIDQLAQQLLAGATHTRTRRRMPRPAEFTTEPFPAKLLPAQPTPTQLTRALDKIDAANEIGLRLQRSARADDGFLSTFLLRPLSWRITGRAVAWGLKPSQITSLVLAVGLLSAGLYAVGWLIAGSLLLGASLLLSCVDGGVARFTRTASPRGGWLDARSARVRECAVFGGLALGVPGGAKIEWLLALAGTSLFIIRDFADFGYSNAIRKRPPEPNAGVAAWSRRTNLKAWTRYAKRAMVAPTNERTLLLAAFVPLLGVRNTLVVMVVLGLIATIWTAVGRFARMIKVAHNRADQLRWLRPAAARMIEHLIGIVVISVCIPQALPAAYVWLAVASLCEYEAIYRQRLVRDWRPRGPIRWLRWQGRNFILSATVLPALLDRPLLTGQLLLSGAALLAVWLILSSELFWRRSLRE